MNEIHNAEVVSLAQRVGGDHPAPRLLDLVKKSPVQIQDAFRLDPALTQLCYPLHPELPNNVHNMLYAGYPNGLEVSEPEDDSDGSSVSDFD